MYKSFAFVRRRGLEPPRPYGHIHLKDACLPVSTPAHNTLLNNFNKLNQPATDYHFSPRSKN